MLGLAVLGLVVLGLVVLGLAVVGLAVVGLGDELVVLDELGDDIDEGALVLLDDELGDLRASARRIGGGELGWVVLLDGDVVDELGGLAGVDELVVADGDEGDDEGCDADGACEAEGAAEGVAAEVGAAEVCACAAALLNINAMAAAAVERLSLVICHPSCQFQV